MAGSLTSVVRLEARSQRNVLTLLLHRAFMAHRHNSYLQLAPPAQQSAPAATSPHAAQASLQQRATRHDPMPATPPQPPTHQEADPADVDAVDIAVAVSKEGDRDGHQWIVSQRWVQRSAQALASSATYELEHKIWIRLTNSAGCFQNQ